jgi:hypothetical protein
MALCGDLDDELSKAVEAVTKAGTLYYLRRLIIDHKRKVSEKRKVVVGGILHGNLFLDKPALSQAHLSPRSLMRMLRAEKLLPEKFSFDMIPIILVAFTKMS